MRKIRGVIDPFTLGFLLSLIGTTTAFVVHGNMETDNTTDAATLMDEQTVVTLSVDDSELFY